MCWHKTGRSLNMKKNVFQFDQKVAHHELEKEFDKLIRWKENALKEIEDRKKALRHEKDSYELKQREDKLDFNTKKALHAIQTKMDKLNQERDEVLFEFEKKEEHLQRDIRDAKHEHEKRATQLGYQERDIKLVSKEERLNAYNKQVDLFYKEKMHELKKKESFYALEVEKGNLSAEKKLHTLRMQVDEIQRQKKDLLFTEREIKNLAREKKTRYSSTRNESKATDFIRYLRPISPQ